MWVEWQIFAILRLMDGSEILYLPVEVGERYFIQLFTGFYTSQVVVWDFLPSTVFVLFLLFCFQIFSKNGI